MSSKKPDETKHDKLIRIILKMEAEYRKQSLAANHAAALLAMKAATEKAGKK